MISRTYNVSNALCSTFRRMLTKYDLSYDEQAGTQCAFFRVRAEGNTHASLTEWIMMANLSTRTLSFPKGKEGVAIHEAEDMGLIINNVTHRHRRTELTVTGEGGHIYGLEYFIRNISA